MIRFDAVSALPSAITAADLKCVGQQLSQLLRIRSDRFVGVRFVTPSVIRDLNAKYRGIRRPTDVLSFEPLATALSVKAVKEERQSLGDLVICPSYAKTEASRRGVALREELVRLLAHGVLHLSGYDHVTEKDERRMFGIQERCVVSAVGVSRFTFHASRPKAV